MSRRIADQYELVSRLGSGAMGEVWRGQDVRLDRAVAIKALKAELSNDQVAFERFRTEAIALAKLQHPNIAGIYNFVSEAGQSYLVMELVEGVGLDDWLKANGKMGWQKAAEVVQQVLSALEQVHRLGLIHRDIKSSNLKMTPDGQVKLLDFGITRSKGQERLTRQGLWIGTLEYASPEQLRGAEADARADLYALGCVFFELLSGRVPFQASTDYELIKSHIEQPPPDLSALDPSIPRFVSSVILKSLEKDPEQRFQSAEAFAKAILDAKEIPVTQRLAQGIEEAALKAKEATVKLAAPVAQEVGKSLARPFNWKSPSLAAAVLMGAGAALWLASNDTKTTAPVAPLTTGQSTAAGSNPAGTETPAKAEEPAATAKAHEPTRMSGGALPPEVSVPGANPALPSPPSGEDGIEVVKVAPKPKPKPKPQPQPRPQPEPAVPSTGWGVR